MIFSTTQKRRLVWAVTALAVFIVTLISLRPQPQTSRPQFLVANRDVPSGAPLHSFFFGLARPDQITGGIPSDAVSDQELHLLKGTLVNLPIRQGDLLRRSHLRLAEPPKRISEQIPLGSRAYLIEVSAGATGVKSGDRIDVILSRPSAGAVTVAENLLVLESFEGREITVAVTVPELETLELARGNGTFGAVLRNPRDRQRGQRLNRKVSHRPIPIFHEG